MDEWMDDGWVDGGWMERWMNGWMRERWMDGGRNGWLGGWMKDDRLRAGGRDDGWRDGPQLKPFLGFVSRHQTGADLRDFRGVLPAEALVSMVMESQKALMKQHSSCHSTGRVLPVDQQMVTSNPRAAPLSICGRVPFVLIFVQCFRKCHAFQFVCVAHLNICAGVLVPVSVRACR